VALGGFSNSTRDSADADRALLSAEFASVDSFALLVGFDGEGLDGLEDARVQL
jgi:hypothetical protein